ncbi:MAG TPA: flagellar basal body P-ring formation chaperone FlgA [Xanthobacteraceae bacterium]|nr:flagellar basal body P-ring formation chaperone FlgA [Xanthobacteraceae bacterium]
MIRRFAFALLLAAAPAAALAGEASPPTPVLKAAATVSADIVRIGDLVDNAGTVADAPIFRAPDIGTTGSVSVAQVLDAIEPYHIFLIDTGSISRVQVTRPGRAIDLADIEARIARAFAGRYGLGEAKNLSVTLDAAQPVMVDPAAAGDLVLKTAVLSPITGRFEIAFDLPGQAAGRRTAKFTGTVVETVAVAVTMRALATSTVIRASDLAIERRPKSQVSAETIIAADNAVGLAVRTPVRAGQPLRRTDLMTPQLVHRDDEVTLVYQVPGIMLTTRGKALEAGGDGDAISVLNVETKRTIQGVVSGPNRVTIMSTMRRASRDVTAAIPGSVASR